MILRKTDLHNHFTTLSVKLEPDKVIENVYRRLGRGGVCGLLNYSDRRFEAFAEQAGNGSHRMERFGNTVYFPDFDIHIVRGEEVPTEQGDLIVLALPENVFLTQKRSIGYSLSEGHELGGINYITTPFYRSSIGQQLRDLPELLDVVDVMEINNGLASHKANSKAQSLYDWATDRQHARIGAVSSSDGHTFREVGSSFTTFHTPDDMDLTDPETFTENLRDMIKYKPRIHNHKRSLLGFWWHATVIGGLILMSKAKVNLSLGDPEALRKQ